MYLPTAGFLFNFNHISSRSEFSPFPAPCPRYSLIIILLLVPSGLTPDLLVPQSLGTCCWVET